MAVVRDVVRETGQGSWEGSTSLLGAAVVVFLCLFPWREWREACFHILAMLTPNYLGTCLLLWVCVKNQKSGYCLVTGLAETWRLVNSSMTRATSFGTAFGAQLLLRPCGGVCQTITEDYSSTWTSWGLGMDPVCHCYLLVTSLFSPPVPAAVFADCMQQFRGRGGQMLWSSCTGKTRGMALLAEMGLGMMEHSRGTGVTLQMILIDTRSIIYTSLLPHF